MKGRRVCYSGPVRTFLSPPRKRGSSLFLRSVVGSWVPAFAGMTGWGERRGKPRPTMTRAAESIGIAAVLVQAKDEKGRRAWYLRQAEWLEFPAGSRTLWLPVGVVI